MLTSFPADVGQVTSVAQLPEAEPLEAASFWLRGILDDGRVDPSFAGQLRKKDILINNDALSDVHKDNDFTEMLSSMKTGALWFYAVAPSFQLWNILCFSFFFK